MKCVFYCIFSIYFLSVFHLYALCNYLPFAQMILIHIHILSQNNQLVSCSIDVLLHYLLSAPPGIMRKKKKKQTNKFGLKVFLLH